MQTNKLTASALLICTCVIWGIQPMFAKFVVREMQPIPMVSIRYTIVALTLFAMLAWRGEKLLPPRRTWPALFTMGILGVCINNVTQFTGLQYSTVTNFTIIATLTPIVTALLSFVLIHERLHRLQLAGDLQQPVRRAVPAQQRVAGGYFKPCFQYRRRAVLYQPGRLGPVFYYRRAHYRRCLPLCHRCLVGLARLANDGCRSRLSGAL